MHFFRIKPQFLIKNKLKALRSQLFYIDSPQFFSQCCNVQDKLIFFVNGEKIEDDKIDPQWTLVHYLRKNLHLCGTKIGCNTGGCGACTVMVSKYDRENKKEIHFPVNACLAPVCSMHGLAVTTIEGLGSSRTKLHPLQETIAKAYGTQCGFCTPAMVISMYTLLRQNSSPSMTDLSEALQGNLCRCVGYGPIMEGFKSYCQGCVCKGAKSATGKTDNKLFKPKDFIPIDPSQEPIFPPELKLDDKYDKQFLQIKGPFVEWYRPTTLQELLELKCTYPEAKLVLGNTEIGVEVKSKNMFYPVLIQPTLIPELLNITATSEGVKVGAAVTLADTKEFLRDQIRQHPESKTRIFRTVHRMLFLFASKQIRSVARLTGNVISGSPISDMVPMLMACNATLEVQSKDKGIQNIPIDNKFFTGYKKNIIDPKDILLSILIPFSAENQYFDAFKQSRRREEDMAIVNMAVNVHFEENSINIKTISVGVGGMSFKVVDAPITQEKLKGLPWTRDTLEIAYPCLLEDVQLEPNAPGGMIQYRKTLALSLFLKLFLSISEQLQKAGRNVCLEPSELSGTYGFFNKEYNSTQYYTTVPGSQKKEDALQRPIVVDSAFKHATGEAIFVDDIPSFDNELFITLVLSTKANAEIECVCTKEALQLEGVIGFVSADDLTEEENILTEPDSGDERVFYNKKVLCTGLPICGIVATTQAISQKAAKLVKVTYKELEPIILTIEEAIKCDSFWPAQETSVFDYGKVDEALAKAKHTIKGVIKSGNQKNFYLETHGLLCIPKEDNEMEIYCSTQRPMEVHTYAAKVLSLPINKLSVKVKRIGGGFGGKQWRSVIITLPAAVAAHKYRQPVRCILERDEDTLMVGGRTPFMVDYKVGFDDTGKIDVGDFKVYGDSGYSINGVKGADWKLSMHLDSGFKYPNFRSIGRMVKTNTAGNNPTRGFGRPEGIFHSLFIIENIAECLKKDFAEICQVNCYKEGDETHYKQKVDGGLRKCFDQCLAESDYYKRRKAIEKFNCENRYKKRGLTIMPAKYGIGREPHLNWMAQAAALIMVYLDGSVLLHHGGVEMGQGLHTKMIQIATRVLELPIERIFIDMNDTHIVPNCNSTNASLSSDLYGPAVIDACTKIKERIAPYKAANPSGTWNDWVNSAYLDKVSLSATGFFGHPDNPFDTKTKTGTLFDYYVYGSSCSEVEIDVLTGDHQLLRTDIVMDLGESLNPAIDIGQIEGAFMMGYGLFVLEEVVHTRDGQLLTTGPGTYKIPGFGDTPGLFNVSLLKGSSNPRAVFSSKAVGEPPLGLAGAVFFAIKDAIKAARRDNGVPTAFRLDAPATAEKIRMACGDKLTEATKCKCGGNR